MKKVLVAFLIFLMAALAPMSLFAEQSQPDSRSYNALDVCGLAKTEAVYDDANNSCLWQTAGCLLGPIAIIAGFFLVPAVPPNRLIGKTPAYVINYTTCFQDEIRSQQFGNTAYGCIYWVMLGVGIYFYTSMFAVSL